MRRAKKLLLPFNRLGGVNLPPLKPVSNQVSTRYFTVSNSSANRQNNRIQRRLTANLTGNGLVLRYAGFFFQAGGGGDQPQNGTTKLVEQVWIEYPTGVMTQGLVVGTGATSFTLTNSYSSIVDVYFPIKPNKGDIFYEQNSCQITGSNLFEAPNSTLPGDYNSYTLISGNSSKAQYPAGDPNAIAVGTGGGQAWGASVVLGYSKQPAFILGSGDSKMDGAGGDQTVGIVENPGAEARLLNNNYGFYRLTCPSSTILAGTNGVNVLNLVLGGCKYGYIEQGINPVLAGSSLALMQAQYKNLVKNQRQAGCRFVIGETLIPNTASSIAITSLTSVTTTATATVADTSLMTNGMSVTVSGATPAAYNGTYTVTILNSTQFSYTFAGGTSPATGANIAWGDSWTTYASQSYSSQTSAAKEAVRVAFNSWLTSTKADGQLDAVYDLAGITADPAHPGLWPTPAFMQATGAPAGTATADGTHASTTFNTWAKLIGQAAFDAMIASLETSSADPKGLGTTLKTSFARPTKKTANITLTNVTQPYWQVWDGNTTTALVDQSTGATWTGVTISRGTQAWTSASNGNTTYDVGNYHELPDAVITQFNRFQVTPVVLTIAGFDPAKTYNLSHLAGANGTGSNPKVTVSGISAGTPTSIVAGQIVNTVAIGNVDPTHFNNIAPDAGGNITISMTRDTGQSFGVFNALSISEN